jgi:hypothetical protein
MADHSWSPAGIMHKLLWQGLALLSVALLPSLGHINAPREIATAEGTATHCEWPDDCMHMCAVSAKQTITDTSSATALQAFTKTVHTPVRAQLFRSSPAQEATFLCVLHMTGSAGHHPCQQTPR